MERQIERERQWEFFFHHHFVGCRSIWHVYCHIYVQKTTMMQPIRYRMHTIMHVVIDRPHLLACRYAGNPNKTTRDMYGSMSQRHSTYCITYGMAIVTVPSNVTYRRLHFDDCWKPGRFRNPSYVYMQPTYDTWTYTTWMSFPTGRRGRLNDGGLLHRSNTIRHVPHWLVTYRNVDRVPIGSYGKVILDGGGYEDVTYMKRCAPRW